MWMDSAEFDTVLIIVDLTSVSETAECFKIPVVIYIYIYIYVYTHTQGGSNMTWTDCKYGPTTCTVLCY